MTSPDSSTEAKALGWRCRRGMRELDVVLTAYLSERYPHANPALQAGFRCLLELQDPEIFAFLTQRSVSQDPAIAAIIADLQRHAEG